MDAYGVNVHPAVSTVTFPRRRAPRLRRQNAAGDVRGARRVPGAIGNAVLSHPETGKHLSFDGRMLHGAPRELAREGSGLRDATTCGSDKPADVEPFPKRRSGSSERRRGVTRWVRVAPTEEKIRRDATPPRRRADVGAKTRRRRGGRRDPKNHPKRWSTRSGDGHGARAGRCRARRGRQKEYGCASVRELAGVRGGGAPVAATTAVPRDGELTEDEKTRSSR